MSAFNPATTWKVRLYYRLISLEGWLHKQAERLRRA